MAGKLYFLYARVSKSDYIGSLDSQVGVLKNIADDAHNKRLYAEHTIIAEDESGSNETRPKFDEMLRILEKDSKEPATKRQYEGVIFFKIDRLFRNFDDFHKVEKLMNAGYRFISATETIENTPTGRLLFRMLAGFAIYESDKLSNRESFTYIMNSLKNDFGKLGGKVPLGYRVHNTEKGEKTIVVNDDERMIIRKIYELRCNNP